MAPHYDGSTRECAPGSCRNLIIKFDEAKSEHHLILSVEEEGTVLSFQYTPKFKD